MDFLNTSHFSNLVAQIAAGSKNLSRRFLPICVGMTKRGEFYYVTNKYSCDLISGQASLEFVAYVLRENETKIEPYSIFSSLYYIYENKPDAELVSIACEDQDYLHQGIGSNLIMIGDAAMWQLQYNEIYGIFQPFGYYKNRLAAEKFYLKNGFSFVKNDKIVIKKVNQTAYHILATAPKTSNGFIILPSAQRQKPAIKLVTAKEF